MEKQGKFVSYNATKGEITLYVGEVLPDTLNALQRANMLDIKVCQHREKRSLDSNAYCWILCTKIAEKVKSSKDEVYEEMIQKYGYMSDITITVKSIVDMAKIDGHWKFIKESSDGKFKAYQMIRGSSDYDRREMSHFTDMIVGEAKELGIETLTPHQLQEMYAMIGEKE